MSESESWDNWRVHILSEIKRANDNFTLLTAAVANLHVETAKLQVKSGIWGIMGGMIPIIVVFLMQKIK